MRDPLEFLCISQSDVERVVTISSSGTTGQPKRVFFNRANLESTVDFFQHGMATLVEVGQRVLILMPWGSPGSVGGFARRGARPHRRDRNRSRAGSGMQMLPSIKFWPIRHTAWWESRCRCSPWSGTSRAFAFPTDRFAVYCRAPITCRHPSLTISNEHGVARSVSTRV